MKKTLVALMLVTVSAAAHAHGFRQQPSLLGALVQAGNHGSVANVAARVASPSSLADVHANVLGNAVKADIDVGQSSRRGSALLNLNASVLGGGVGNRQDRW